jgi:hypothetical protein
MIGQVTTRSRAGVAYGPPTIRSALVFAAIVVVIAMALLWPAIINRGPLVFFDTIGYLSQGRSTLELVVDKIMPEPTRVPAPVSADAPRAPEGAAIAAPETERDAPFVRSIVFPAFAYLGSLGPLGFSGTLLLQSLIVAALVGVIAGREASAHSVAAAIAAAVCVGLTSAPWTVSTLMPDVFASIAILCAMIIAARLDRIGVIGKLFVLGAATLASLSHYGHTPLFLAVAAAALLALLAQRRLGLWAVLLTIGPLAITMATSLGVATVVFDEESVTPRRLPLLLARSMVDGPALWHLEEHCDEHGYAVCELWDGDMPDNLTDLLWRSDSMLKKASDEQMDRIRQEEFLILKRAMLEYPAVQTWSFVGNAVRQLSKIGMEDTAWGTVVEGADGSFQRERSGSGERSGLESIARVQEVVVLGALGLIVVWIVRDGLRAGDRERSLLFVAIAGLVANAAIFGGLSAPVDRYQARVIWIIPMLAALFWLVRRDTVPAEERAIA